MAQPQKQDTSSSLPGRVSRLPAAPAASKPASAAFSFNEWRAAGPGQLGGTAPSKQSLNNSSSTTPGRQTQASRPDYGSLYANGTQGLRPAGFIPPAVHTTATKPAAAAGGTARPSTPPNVQNLHGSSSSSTAGTWQAQQQQQQQQQAPGLQSFVAGMHPHAHQVDLAASSSGMRASFPGAVLTQAEQEDAAVAASQEQGLAHRASLEQQQQHASIGRRSVAAAQVAPSRVSELLQQAALLKDTLSSKGELSTSSSIRSSSDPTHLYPEPQPRSSGWGRSSVSPQPAAASVPGDQPLTPRSALARQRLGSCSAPLEQLLADEPQGWTQDLDAMQQQTRLQAGVKRASYTGYLGAPEHSGGDPHLQHVATEDRPMSCTSQPAPAAAEDPSAVAAAAAAAAKARSEAAALNMLVGASPVDDERAVAADLERAMGHLVRRASLARSTTSLGGSDNVESHDPGPSRPASADGWSSSRGSLSVGRQEAQQLLRSSLCRRNSLGGSPEQQLLRSSLHRRNSVGGSPDQQQQQQQHRLQQQQQEQGQTEQQQQQHRHSVRAAVRSVGGDWDEEQQQQQPPPPTGSPVSNTAAAAEGGIRSRLHHSSSSPLSTHADNEVKAAAAVEAAAQEDAWVVSPIVTRVPPRHLLQQEEAVKHVEPPPQQQQQQQKGAGSYSVGQKRQQAAAQKHGLDETQLLQVCEVRLREWAAADAAQRAAGKPHVLWSKAWAAVTAVFKRSNAGGHGRVLPMPVASRSGSFMDGAPRTRSSLEFPASESVRSSLVLAAASSSTSVTPGAPGTHAVLARALSHQASRSGQPAGFDHPAGSNSSRLSRQGSSAGSNLGWPSSAGAAAGAAVGAGPARGSMDRGVAWWESRTGSTSMTVSTPKPSIRPLGLAAFPPPSPVGPAPGPPAVALGSWGSSSLAGPSAADAAAAGWYQGEGVLLSPHQRPSSPSALLTRHPAIARASAGGVSLSRDAAHVPLSPSYSGKPRLSADWGHQRHTP